MFKATRLEQIAVDLYEAGVIDLFQGINGSNPMSLSGASTSKLWLKAYDNPVHGGEDATHGRLLAYVSGDATNEDNWFELTPALLAVHLSGFLGSFQPLDTDLTAIAAISPSNDDIIQRKAGAWTNRTMAQLIADLAALGTTFQPLDSDLTSWAGVTRASGFDTFAATPSLANLGSLLTDDAAGLTTFMATPSSANLRSLLTDESGSGAAYFQGGDLGTPSAGVLTNATGLPTAGLVNDAVTFAKMQNISTDRLVGRDTAASGDPEEISVGGGLEFTGSAGIQRSALTGDVTASAGGNSTTIPMTPSLMPKSRMSARQAGCLGASHPVPATLRS